MASLASKLTCYVTLERRPQVTDDADGFWEPLSPKHVWAGIDPVSPGGAEGRSLFHVVTMRYHPEVTMDTRITYGTRELFVRSVQNLSEANERLILYCEEIVP